MSVTFEVQDDIAEIKVSGQCSEEELYKGFKDFICDKGICQNTHMLINVGESETLPPGDAIEQIAFIIGTARERFSGRVSVYVNEQVRYGLARQLSVYLESFDLVSEPFYEYEQAVGWLRQPGQA